MPLSKSSMGPARIVIRPFTLLPAGPGAPGPGDAVFGPPAARMIVRCAHAEYVRLSVEYEEGMPGGAPAFIAEGFDGVNWDRLTLDNVGTLFVLPPVASPAQPGTASVVDQYVKWFQPRGAISESFSITLGKVYVAVRFDFAEYPVLTQATPGMLSAAVTVPSGV